MCENKEGCKGDGSCGKCKHDRQPDIDELIYGECEPTPTSEPECYYCVPNGVKVCGDNCRCFCHEEWTDLEDVVLVDPIKRVPYDTITPNKIFIDPTHRCSGNCKNMGEVANQGLARDDSLTSTRLLDKHYSPMIVRKYMIEGWPMYVSLICDANLNDLDEVVNNAIAGARNKGLLDGSIQNSRNVCGYVNEIISKHYDNVKRGCVEGVAALWYIDKCFISSLMGDFMVHLSCKTELYQIINTLPHI